MNQPTKELVQEAAKILQSQIHGMNAHWWIDTEGKDIRLNPLTFSNKLLLVVTEIAEACEADRKDLMDDKIPNRHGREVELADAVIRLFDLAGGFGMDLSGAIAEKMMYNASRADHTAEARRGAGGKKY